MDEIYQNAHVTLAAGASANDDGGFFVTVPDECIVSKVVFVDIGQQLHEVYLRRGVSHPDSKHSIGDLLPLMTRGWCFQE